MRDKRLQVRISPEEIDLLEQAAARAHMTLSEFVRLVCMIGARGTLALGVEDAPKMLEQSTFMLFGRTKKKEDEDQK